MNSPAHHLDSFERDLLLEMRSVVSTRAAVDRPSGTTPWRRRPVQAAAAAGAIVAAASAAVLTSGSPAFAVGTADDGSIVVSISELSDADGLEAALADHGVLAEVDYAGEGSTVTIDPEGWVSVGDGTATGPDLAPTDPDRMDLTWLGTDGDLPADPASTCGGSDGVAPITLERDGSGYVVTLAGPTLGQDNALRLSTVTGTSGDSLFAAYTYGDHTCGAGVSS